MNRPPSLNCCRMCGATSYRHVIARDGSGAMTPAGLYQCSGCSVVFTDPVAWREGPEASTVARAVVAGPTGPSSCADRLQNPPDVPRAPDFRNYGLVPFSGVTAPK